MVRKMLSLIVLGVFLAIGGLWGLRAQDPAAPQKPATTPVPQKPDTMPVPQKTETMQSERRTQTANSTPVDLSGTYAGTFNCESAGLVGDTTLTINGNEFTTADGRTGRITASKTKGYTAVAFQVNGTDATAAPTVVSMRARKSGNKLTLSPVSGAMRKCSFVTSKNTARTARTTKTTRTPKTTPATGSEVANPAAEPMPNPSPSPMPMPTV